MEISRTELSSAAAASAGPSQDLRGAEILVKALQAEGVKYVWGYPGGAVLHIYDAFYKQDTIQHVLVRHEQAAVHAADGYARATGDVGVALVTSGPGVTNAVTGIATAIRPRHVRSANPRSVCFIASLQAQAVSAAAIDLSRIARAASALQRRRPDRPSQ